MNEKTLNKILKDKQFLNKRLKFYEKKEILIKKYSHYEIKGHLEKSRHNLELVSEMRNKFNDWIIVICYYAAYHSALALILTKGYFSKNHDATICKLVQEFYKKELSKEEIKYLNLFNIDEILFYIESKNKREEASYSTKIIFENNLIKNIKINTISFVNKVEEIINKS